jgi:hypothetical protein
MMKKILFILISAIAIFSLNGCDSGTDYDDEIRFHLVDQEGYGVSDIRYTCDGETIEKTDGSGGFYFDLNTDCSLQLDITVNSTEDKLFIENDDGIGVRDIAYECTSGLFGRTDRDGHFEFDNVAESDICTFQL